MEPVDVSVLSDENRDAVGDVLEELEVAGVRGTDYVAEDDEEGAQWVGEQRPALLLVGAGFLWRCKGLTKQGRGRSLR